MVLTLKRWKSRTPPGIAADGQQGMTHSQVKGLSPRGWPFFASSVISDHDGASPSEPLRLRKAHWPPAAKVSLLTGSEEAKAADAAAGA